MQFTEFCLLTLLITSNLESEMTKLKPPPVRQERKVPYLSLFFPGTARIGTIGIYRLDASGLHLIRVLHGCKVH